MSRKRHTIPTVFEVGFPIRQVRPGYYFVDVRRQDVVIQKGFSDLAAAQDYCRRKAEEIKFKGTEAAALPDKLRWEAVEASSLLTSTGVSLVDAVKFYLSHHRPATGARTVKQLTVEHLDSLTKIKKRRPQTIRERKYRLDAFNKTFGDTPVQQITRRDVEDWLDKGGWSNLNRRHYTAAVHTLFAYARKQALIENNPAADIEKPSYTPSVPVIPSPAEIQSLLNQANKDEPAILPALALSFFCGLRPNEIAGLEWKDVNIEERFIRIIPAVAKMRRQRHVELSPNTVTWLKLQDNAQGPVCPIAYPTFRAKLAALEKTTDVKLSYNAGRHAFASYHFALHAPEETAKQLGHARTDLLVTTYRGLVTKKAAQAFWQIKPAQSKKPASSIKEKIVKVG